MKRRAPGAIAAEPCRAALVILDFDGTLTDCDAHTPRFHAASSESLARRLGWDEATRRREWERGLAIVTRLPAHTPWIADGAGVCPAACDPYVLANGVARRLLAEHAPALDAASATAALLEVHREAYERVPPSVRLDARDLLEELLGRDLRVAVVSNSHTGTVERALDALAFRGRDRVRVRGAAGKFTLGRPTRSDPRFDALPATVEWPELPRPIHLRRGRSFDVLRALWEETATSPETTLTVGDVFELDLAMPAALGAHAHLVTRASTLPHEVRLARALARGDADDRLVAVVERLER